MAIVTCAAAVSHERARSPEARATAGLWSVWADAHDLDLEFEFEFEFKMKFVIKAPCTSLSSTPIPPPWKRHKPESAPPLYIPARCITPRRHRRKWCPAPAGFCLRCARPAQWPPSANGRYPNGGRRGEPSAYSHRHDGFRWQAG